MLTVIIPTRNRSHFLHDAIHSILNQSLSEDRYEIIVVDNGSKDDTKEIAEKFEKKSKDRIRYIYEGKPGLHNGRHRGAAEAQGDILVFVDDDIIADRIWLEMILKSFSSKNIALVGGKILPKWEGDVPQWINEFKTESKFGCTIGYLSLLDFGDTPKEIPGKFVFGCNLSIRKNVLFECGGFHPDGMPRELIQFRGDGETALVKAVQKHGYKIMYEPKAVVYHRIPQDRLTVQYFCERAFNQGISQSYTEIRRQNGMENNHETVSKKSSLMDKLKAIVMEKYRKQFERKSALIRKEVKKAFHNGIRYHREQVKKNPDLLSHVLRENYIECDEKII